MKKSFDVDLNSYLKDNGIEEVSSDNKEKLKQLYNIVRTRRVDMDCLDFKYSTDKSCMAAEDYVSTIQNLQINITEGYYYICNVKDIIKEEKRFAAKVKKLFGIKEK